MLCQCTVAWQAASPVVIFLACHKAAMAYAACCHVMCCAGFSGETEEEHAATLDLLRNTRYDNAFLFSYSERAKTYASRHLPDDVPEDVKRRRLAEAFEAYRWVLKQTTYCTRTIRP